MRRRVVLLVLLLAVPNQGQGFAEAWAEAERLRLAGADAAAQRAACAAALDAFLALTPESEPQRAALPHGAWCALATERFELAADLYERVLGGGPTEPAVVENALRAQLLAGRGQRLLAHASALEATFPDAVRRVLVDEGGLRSARALEVADRWLRQDQVDAGLWVFRYAAESQGRDALAVANLALALRHVGREQECEHAYREALAKSPRDALIWNDYGLFLKGAGRLGEAEAAFLESWRLESAPRSGPATASLVLVGRRTGRAVLEDPGRALAEVVAGRPDALLARRVYLDHLCSRGRESRPFRASAPDSDVRAR